MNVHLSSLDGGDFSVAPQLGLLLVEGDELGVDRDEVAGLGHLVHGERGERDPLAALVGGQGAVLEEDLGRDRVGEGQVLDLGRLLDARVEEDAGDLPVEVDGPRLGGHDGVNTEVVENVPLAHLESIGNNLVMLCFSEKCFNCLRRKRFWNGRKDRHGWRPRHCGPSPRLDREL